MERLMSVLDIYREYNLPSIAVAYQMFACSPEAVREHEPGRRGRPRVRVPQNVVKRVIRERMEVSGLVQYCR